MYNKLKAETNSMSYDSLCALHEDVSNDGSIDKDTRHLMCTHIDQRLDKLSGTNNV